MYRANKSVLVEGSPALGNAVYYIEGACVAADEGDLPTEGIAMGSRVYVIDDGSWIFFNEEESAWVDENGSPLEKLPDVPQIPDFPGVE